MKKISLNKKAAFLALILLLIPQISFARSMSEFSPSPWTYKEGYGRKIVSKLGYGLLNLGGGWTALASEYKEPPEDNLPALFLRSVARTVTNTVGGALHVVTFPFTFDIPLPGGGTTFE